LFICIRVCKCRTRTHTNTYTCTHKHTYAHISIHIHTHIHTHIHIRMHTYMHTHAYTRTRAQTCTHIRAHTHAQTHTQIHPNAHARARMHTDTCTLYAAAGVKGKVTYVMAQRVGPLTHTHKFKHKHKHTHTHKVFSPNTASWAQVGSFSNYTIKKKHEHFTRSRASCLLTMKGCARMHEFDHEQRGGIVSDGW